MWFKPIKQKKILSCTRSYTRLYVNFRCIEGFTIWRLFSSSNTLQENVQFVSYYFFYFPFLKILLRILSAVIWQGVHTRLLSQQIWFSPLNHSMMTSHSQNIWYKIKMSSEICTQIGNAHSWRHRVSLYYPFVPVPSNSL